MKQFVRLSHGALGDVKHALHSRCGHRQRGVSVGRLLSDLMVVLFVLAVHLLLLVASLWIAVVLLRQTPVSVALRWVSMGAFVVAIVLAIPAQMSSPAGAGSQFFFLRYMWPSLLCIAIALLWSRRMVTSRSV